MSPPAPPPPPTPSDLPPPERGEAPEFPRWRLGDRIELDESPLQLWRDGVAVAIERQPLELLMLLLRQPGEVLTEKALCDALWPDGQPRGSTLGGCVTQLRQALGDAAQTMLRTVPGLGYRLAAAVERRAARPGALVRGAAALHPGDRPPQRPDWRLVERYPGTRSETWRAEQDGSGASRVFRFALEPAALERLQREIELHRRLRETLGLREDIVRVLAWNFSEPPCYIEFEPCSGGDLATWFAAQGGANRVPRTVRLDIAVQACDAIAAAHAAGVLHLNLKPASLLVQPRADGHPRIRLSGFGSDPASEADRRRAQEAARPGFSQLLTADATAAGDWAYLAPEVAAGHPATARADIHALGVLLYQLVAGDLRLALAPGWERDVPDPMLSADVAAACDPDPVRRLGDAAELARRLRRLDQRHAEAAAHEGDLRRQAEARRELARSRRRQRWLGAGATAAGAGLVAMAALLFSVRDARDAAQRSVVRAEHDAAVASAVIDFLQQDVLAAAARGSARPPAAGDTAAASTSATASTPSRLPALRAALDAAAGRAESQPADPPALAAALQANLARAYVGLDAPGPARAALTRAAALYRGPAADPQRLLDVLLALADLQDDGKPDADALGPAEEAVAVAQALEPPQPLRRLEADASLAWVRRHDAGAADATITQLGTHYQSARAMGSPAAGIADRIRFRLARVLLDAGRQGEALPLLREHIDHETATYGAQSLEAALARRELGRALALSGSFKEARSVFDEVLALQRRELAADDRDLLATLNELAATYDQAGAHGTAERLWTEVADAGQRRYGDGWPLAVSALGRAAAANRRLERYDRALLLARRTVEAQAGSPGVPPAEVLLTRFRLAQALLDAGRPGEALSLMDAIEREAPAAVPADSLLQADFALRRAQALSALHRPTEALRLVKQAVARYADAAGADAERRHEAQRLLTQLETAAQLTP